MDILFLSSWYPFPADNGSKLRVYNLLRGLAKQHTITLFSLTDQPNPETPPELQALCQNVHTIQRRPYHPTSMRAVTGLLSPTPRSVLDTYQQEVATFIKQIIKANDFDLIIASQWWTAAYQESFAGIPAIYEEVETGLLTSKITRASNLLGRLRHTLPLFKLQAHLRRTLPRFQTVTVVSEIEKDLLQKLVPGCHHIHVIPNGIETADYKNLPHTNPTPDTLIFTGTLSYSANLTGLQWFIEEVFPKIQEKAPQIKLLITGRSENIPLPQAKNIIRTGYVEDVRPLIASAWISIAPILEGGGTRLKILESMAIGTPVVATSKGAEGLQVQNNEHILLADTPDQFATATLNLLQDSKLRLILGQNSCHLVREHYDWGVIMPDFLKLVEEAVYV